MEDKTVKAVAEFLRKMHSMELGITFRDETINGECVLYDMRGLDWDDKGTIVFRSEDEAAVRAKGAHLAIEHRARQMIEVYQKAAGSEYGKNWTPPQGCDGKEQIAFEAWATSKRYDMYQHPLHYLFLDKHTNAARQGWNAALHYVRDDFAARTATEPEEWFSKVVNFFVEHGMLDAREEYDINDVMSALVDNYAPTQGAE